MRRARRAALDGDGDGRPPDRGPFIAAYAIVDEKMHREAAALLEAWTDEQRAKASAKAQGRVKKFAKRMAS